MIGCSTCGSITFTPGRLATAQSTPFADREKAPWPCAVLRAGARAVKGKAERTRARCPDPSAAFSIQGTRPMSIDTATARKVAKLARIRVEEADLPKLAEQLSGILGFMEQLNEVDVTGIEPMVSVTPMRLARRADVVTDGNIQAQILANAPDAREGFFAVPKVVE